MFGSRPKRKAIRSMITWLAMVAVCLQPVPVFATSCSCENSTERILKTTSCCLIEPVSKTCCSTEQDESTSCCTTAVSSPVCKCNPDASECRCGNCKCADWDDGPSLPPAVPPTESNESQVQSFATTSFLSWIRTRATMYPTNLRATNPRLVSLSSKETCVLLSRFTC